MLEGNLFDKKLFLSSLKNLEKDKKFTNYKDIYFLCSSDFYNSLPLDTRKKILDSLFVTASADGVLEAKEKKYILRFAKLIDIKDSWISKKMPMLLIEGDSKIKASEKNIFGILAIPALASIFFQIYLYLYAEVFSKDFGIVMQLELVILSFTYISFLLSSWIGTKFFFYKSCHNCYSTNIEKISNENSSLMDQNNYQCKDCRVRANIISNDKAELYFSNSPLAENGNKIYRYPKVSFILIFLGYLLWFFSDINMTISFTNLTFVKYRAISLSNVSLLVVLSRPNKVHTYSDFFKRTILFVLGFFGLYIFDIL